ncbi:MAG TPA: hypothetical protein VE422_46810 [Terriglobia bacterium]|nr:hypothetical protein [Terriglobia bacterium]
MELKTQALDRVLEALSPALTAELDRVIDETRQALEQEFQKRLQLAVREAETAKQETAEAELQRAVADVRETTRKQVTEELNEQFRKTLEQSTAALKSEAATELARLQEQLDQWRIFAEAQKLLGEATSQPEILARFLKLTEQFAPALAVYVAKTDGLALWKTRGKAAFPEIISQQTTDPEFYFRIVTVRGKKVAAACAAQPYKTEALDFLVSAMEHAIEIFGLRLRASVAKPEVALKPTPVPAPANAPTPTPAVSKPPAPNPPAPNPPAPTPPTPPAPTPPAPTPPVPAPPVPAPPTPTPSATEASESLSALDALKVQTEARRTARLLVSEIKLYHEDELKVGRQNRDIYERLRKEIDQGREQYNQRVSPAALADHDYFHEELIRILCEGHGSLLGDAYPGPMKS